MRRARAWLATMPGVVLVLGVIAACGSTTPGPADESEADSQSLSATPAPSMSQPPTRPTSPTDQIKPRTVRGTVVKGAEPGCIELVGPSGRWALIGPVVDDMVVGGEVEVVGRPAPEVRSGCDGTPLLVRDVRSL